MQFCNIHGRWTFDIASNVKQEYMYMNVFFLLKGYRELKREYLSINREHLPIGPLFKEYIVYYMRYMRISTVYSISM